MTGDGEHFKYKFKVLARYEAHLSGNESQVTLTVMTGRDDHLSYCGTLTMSEGEWHALKEHLVPALGADLEIEDESFSGSGG